ncbi:gliding motility lipoprotein GldH [Chitinophaga sp.]|uniref:gliding motility lipoprotein GldH n=1 Tax=Chitinophaga sp. TaxID=1869181 RepID=UPI0031D6D33F
MKLYFTCALLGMLVFACKPPRLDTFEKNRDIRRSEWAVEDKPLFELDLAPEDTAFYYNMYVNVRHTDAYPYSNLWILIGTQAPGDSAATTRRVELPLADTYGKWMGSGVNGMVVTNNDDIFEHRIPIQQNAIFSKPGRYRFTFEQNMRQNPLPYILSMGLRIEKAAPRK